ncbi:MAG: DUF3368 domain-containing protein [Blastocatellia bacterium]
MGPWRRRVVGIVLGLCPSRSGGDHRRPGGATLCSGFRHPGPRYVRACARGETARIISEARPVLEKLRQSGMYLSDHVLDQSLALVGE